MAEKTLTPREAAIQCLHYSEGAEKCWATPDGQAFLIENDAKNHSKDAKEFTRSSLEKDIKDFAKSLPAPKTEPTPGKPAPTSSEIEELRAANARLAEALEKQAKEIDTLKKALK